ncbi:MAG: TonB-dependent receptor [Gammaproteobacteria bacterium]
MKQKKLSWLVTSLFTLPGAAGLAHGQEAPAADPAIQTVTVTGIRASMRSALVAKEASNSMVEVVAAEDIGKLPDTTIAESLARLPGMSSGIDRGNASQVVARGLGPRFVGATLNGRELASSEPNRAVRFEQFPAESLTGATVYKTQSAELVEGGVATTIDLQTVRPLTYKSRQASLKVDGLYYELARDIPGAAKVKPRLGGIYVDQFADNTVGVAIAASYQDQPSLVKRTQHWGFNETNNDDLNGDGKADKAPWGFEEESKRGTYKRSSVLGKVEWKPNADLFITGDAYYSKADIKEPGMSHWFENMGNWSDWNPVTNPTARGSRYNDFRNVDVRDGYVVGGTLLNQGVTSNSTLWTQDMDVFASGINAKLNAGAWKLEADLSTSRGARDSQWRDIRAWSSNTGTLNWAFTGDSVLNSSYNLDTGAASNFSAPHLYVDTDGHMRDELSGLHLSGARDVEWGPVSRIKLGARFTDREKKFHQTTWDLNPTGTLPASAFEQVRVDGFNNTFLALKDFNGAVAGAFGASAFDPAGRTPNQNDVLSAWNVKEKSSSVYAQGELDGELFGKTYRGNAGVRVVHTRQSSTGMQSLNGAAPTPAEGGASYTEVLPSLNLIFNMDAAQEQQLRFSVARAMARAPLDEMRASRNLSDGGSENRPLTGSAGNPGLLPMMSNQVDLAYQWYFSKGSLLSAGLFYKQIDRYIGITEDKTTLNGRTATLTRSVNGEGGNVRGIELVYQQLFDNGIGISSNYSYTSSDIHENVPVGNPYPVEGLMKNNGGVTVWYEKNGFEARLSANYHSPFVRNPTWSAGALTVNEAETFVSLGLSKQITPNIQVHFGMDNVTNQKVTYTGAGNPYRQEVFDFGRRYNLGITYKL